MGRPRKVKEDMRSLDVGKFFPATGVDNMVNTPEVTSEVTEEEVALPASTLAEQLAGREALARVHANNKMLGAQAAALEAEEVAAEAAHTIAHAKAVARAAQEAADAARVK